VLCLACIAACSYKTSICHGPGCETKSCDDSSCAGGATQVYRSVGPGSTLPLATGEGNPLTIENGMAVFTTSLPDRVGVGDVILYSPSNELVPTRTAFVAGRTSSTVFAVRTSNGGAADESRTPDTHWSLFRAYTSLADAVLGRVNQGVPSALAAFDQWPNGNDLVGANLVWNIACYADAPDVVDTNVVIIRQEDWITGPRNYLRLFAPDRPTEVGMSQRHPGAYDPTRYQLVRNSNGGNHLIDVFVAHARIEGLQVVDRATNSSDANINVDLRADGSEDAIEGNLLRGGPSSGILVAGQGAGTVKIWNNVLDGFSGACVSDNTTPGTAVTVYLYSNTLYGCRGGVDDRFAAMVAKNNIIDGMASASFCISDLGAFSVLSDYNTCNLDETLRGSHSRSHASVGFLNPGAGDFHLAPDDSVAGGRGTDLSSDAVLPFDDDIDGEGRGHSWDIGADQR
jgi:hypothetical protein